MTKVKTVMVLILATVVAGVAFAQQDAADTYALVGEGQEWTNNIALKPLMPGGVIKNNTTYKVTVTGTSDKALQKLGVTMCSPGWKDSLTVGGWDEAFLIPSKSIPAKKPFVYTTMMVTAANASALAKDLKECHLQLSNGDSSPNQKDKVMATLTNVKISIEEMPEGTYFMRAEMWDNGKKGEWQGNLSPALSLAALLPKGVKNNTTYKITVTGTSDTAMANFRAGMTNRHEQLTSGNIPQIKVDAKKPFTYTVSLTTKEDAATKAKDLKQWFLRLDNYVVPPKGSNGGDLLAILTNIKVTIEEVK